MFYRNRVPRLKGLEYCRTLRVVSSNYKILPESHQSCESFHLHDVGVGAQVGRVFMSLTNTALIYRRERQRGPQAVLNICALAGSDVLSNLGGVCEVALRFWLNKYWY